MIALKNININYSMGKDTVYAIKDASIDFDDIESYGVVGESGSGKSTLLMGALRLLPKNASMSGEIYLDDSRIDNISDDEFRTLRGSTLGVVFQGAMNFLSPVHKIYRQLQEIYNANYRDKKFPDIIEDYLNMVNLPKNILDLYPHELSGGMMQRVAIASTIMLRPKILVMDEATTALDVVTERQILDELISIEKEMKLTRIMITHDMSVVASSTENIIVMYGGYVVELGQTKDVLTSPWHPYTSMLTKTFPDMNSNEKYLYSIGGSLGTLKEMNRGCIFCDRCDKAKNICKDNIPELKEYGDRKVACFYPISKASGENNE